MKYTISVDNKSVSVKYENGIRKRFTTKKPYHHRHLFEGTPTKGSRFTRFNTKFRKLLGDEWVDDVIGQVTSECYNAIVNSAPYSGRKKRYGGKFSGEHYRDHIAIRTPAVNKYLSPDDERRVLYGSIYVKDDLLPNGAATYADLARWLEFGTRSFEITGAGTPSTTRDGEPWGIHPQPHWIPNYEMYKRVLREKIKARLKTL